jgi:Zn-dependent protease
MIFLSNLFSNVYAIIGFLLGILIAITVHEYFHAYSANYFGDPTAKNRGRVSLNPLKHLDPVGTIFLFLAGFGWGKPVPINPNNLKNPKLDQLWIALSGPISNLLVAFIFAIPYKWALISGAELSIMNSPLFIISHYIVDINIILAIFNLLPIPPLDGADIIRVIVPEKIFYYFQKIGPPILFILLFLEFSTITNFSIFSKVFSPIIETLSYIVRVFPFN